MPQVIGPQVIRRLMAGRPLFGLAIGCGLLALLAVAWWLYGRDGSDLWREFIAWIFLKQKEFHRTLTASMGTLSEEGTLDAAWLLILFSFLYGVFHAAGPGHGKAIVTTYLLTHRDKLRRGLMLGVASSFFQGLVAVVLVYGLIYLAGWLPRETNQAVDWSERISFGLLGLMGAFLIWRAGRRIHGRVRPAVHQHDHDHHHDHHHDDHHHHNHADHEACCDHAHGPSAQQIDQASDLKTALGIILSVGLRPCTGAVIVLVLAKALGLVWAGVGAVAAMSLGTAVTVAGLAFAAVHMRNWVAGRFGDRGTGWRIAGDLVGLAGGGMLLAMGGSLLAASFAPAHPLGI